MNNQPELKIKNPLLRLLGFVLIAMVAAIGFTWVLLGVISPILLILLIQKWH